MEEIPFGPWPTGDMLFATILMSILGICIGFSCTEWWIPSILHAKRLPNPPVVRGRKGAELLFIVLHNGLVAVLSLVNIFIGSPKFALYIFCFEIGYEVFDAIALRYRLDPETILHHLMAPMAMLLSMKTTVDVRVLLMLAFGIDFSGAVLGGGKYLLRYRRPKDPQSVYRIFSYVYFPCRIVIPGIATVLILLNLYRSHEWSDWSRNYLWAMSMLNAMNVYYFILIQNRANSTNDRLDCLEDMELRSIV